MADEHRSIECRPCGEETEFGMTLRGKDAANAGPDFANSFDRGGSLGECIGWDADARIREDPEANEERSYFKNKSWLENSNALFPNGARFYLDGGHAEISTPLCLSARDCVLWNRACYAMIDRIRKKYKEAHGKEFTVYRNNIARCAGDPRATTLRNERVTFACHENYTVRRFVPIETLVRVLGCGWFLARIPLIGAGKIGSDNGTPHAEFQMSQRADFMSFISSNDTMFNRGIYNLRDVPYADHTRFRRVHVICGDSNMFAIPELLKIALTDTVLKMIEDSVFPQIEFLNPVHAMRGISRDTGFKNQYDIVGRKERVPILDILSEYHDEFAEYVVRRYSHSKELTETIGLFSGILSLLKRGDSDALVGTLDWATKRHMIAAYCKKKSIAWESDRALQLDYEYSNNDHDNGIWFRRYASRDRRMIPEAMRANAERMPPATRSRFIVAMFRAHARHIAASNYWDRIILKGVCMANHGRYVYLDDPTRAWDPADEALIRLPFDGCIHEGITKGIFVVNPAADPFDLTRDSDTKYQEGGSPYAEVLS